MLLKYFAPIVGLVALQVFLNNRASAATELQTANVPGEDDLKDLEPAELFLRPVVIKYGQDHPGVYTWQGGSGIGGGWGVYQPKVQLQMVSQQGGGGWGGWGQEKMKKKKKKQKKKKKKQKKKKKKKPKKKKKKEKKGGWGWSWGWIEDGGEDGDGEGGGGGGGGGGGRGKKKHSGGGGDDDDSDEKGRSGIKPKVDSVVARSGRPWGYEDQNQYEQYQPHSYYRNSYSF